MFPKMGSLRKERQNGIFSKESGAVTKAVGIGYLSFLPLSEVQLFSVLDTTSLAKYAIHGPLVIFT